MRKLKRAELLLAALLAAAIFIPVSPGASSLPGLKDNSVVLEAPGMGDIVVEDFNLDGLTDIATAGYAQDSVFVYFRSPVGMATQPTVTLHASQPSKIVTGDTNRDDHPDIIVLGVDRFSIFEWQPGDDFQLRSTLFVSNPLDAAVADSGADGLNDIFVTGSFGTTIFLQDGAVPGLFDDVRKFNVGVAQGESLLVTRLDDDVFVDFIVMSSYHLTAFKQFGPHAYEIASAFMLDRMDYNPDHTSLGDMNSDGYEDIVITSPSYHSGYPGVVKILFSNATGGFSLSDSMDVSGDVSTTTITDLEQDGTEEILVSLSNGNIDALSQSSGFALNAPPLIAMPEPEGTRLLESADMDDDSLRDVIVRVAGFIYVFFLEDAPVRMITPIPSTYHLNEGEFVADLIDLDPFFLDDYGTISYALSYEENPSKLDAILADHYLSFDAALDWSGSVMFQIEAWDGNPDNEPTKSNMFSVWVNDAPSITSIAPATAQVGGEYSYQIVVEDNYPLWDVLTYRLIVGSDGMEIDENGLLTWTPSDSGLTFVRVEVRDMFGRSDVQVFSVDVPALPPPPPDVPPETPFVMGTLATLFSAVAVAALVSENVKFALLLLIIPLYTKIRREKVLDHFIRGQIYGYILANPGEHYNAIKQALNLTNGSLAHHLKTLEREEFIKSRKFGLYRRFYPKNMRIPDDEDLQLNNIQKNIVTVINRNPGISQKEIAEAMNVTPPTVNYHIGILASAKMIRVVREGRQTQCFVDTS